MALMGLQSRPAIRKRVAFSRMIGGIEEPSMPLDGKLKPEQVEAIRLWIEQGAIRDELARPQLRSRHPTWKKETSPPRRENTGRFRNQSRNCHRFPTSIRLMHSS